ncbi:MAG: tol-pal system-associated acyl-CoA thioesterase, partial [Gammaproteobacteria bacterium]
VRVFYEDTDAAGLVYHGNYLKFMERARTEWLRQCGHSHGRLHNGESVLFVVTEMSVRFVRPARLDDLLEVRARIKHCTGARLVFEHTINNASGELLCAAEVKVGCLDARSLRPRRLPDSIRIELSDVN